MQTTTDIVIVGHNVGQNLENKIHQFRKIQHLSGVFKHMALSSIIFDADGYHSCPDLINMVIEKSFGETVDCLYEPLSLALVNLTSFLVQHGHRVEIIKTFQAEKDKLSQIIKNEVSAVVIATPFYTLDQNEPIQEIVEFIRSIDPAVPIILGGPRIYMYCKLNSREVQDIQFKRLGADIYIIEEKGMESLNLMADILKNGHKERLSEVPNLAIKNCDGEFTRTKKKKDNTHINDMVIDWKQFADDISPSVGFLQTKRGCPFRCSFCNFHKFVSSVEIKKLERLKKEMDDLFHMGIRFVLFTDDSLNMPTAHFKNILRMMINEEYNFKWSGFIRASNLDSETIELMARSGCAHVLLGIESGDQKILNNMNKKASVQNYATNIDALNKYGIWTHASLIVGFPGETKESVLNTIKFIEHHPPTSYYVNLYYHDMTADIASQKETYNIEGSMSSWKHSTMDWKEAVFWQEYMIKNISCSYYLSNSLFYSLPIILRYKGVSNETIKKLSAYLKKLIFKGLSDPYSNILKDEIHELVKIMES